MNNIWIRKLGGLGMGMMTAGWLGAAALGADTASYQGWPVDSFLQKWLILAPLQVSGLPSPDEAAQKQAFAKDLLASIGGEAKVQPQLGLKQTIGDQDFEWRVVEATNQVIPFQQGTNTPEFVVGYAWADIHMPEPGTILAGFGSDDAIKVWLNGRLVHENWAARPVETDNDLVSLDLAQGRNRLLVKVQNVQGDWGFSCHRPGQEALAKRLVKAAAVGDLEEVKKLIGSGLKVDGRASQGLTAFQMARLTGQKEVADYLAGRGANTNLASPPMEQVADAMIREVVSDNQPGVAVLVARDGKILLEKGYGLASLEPRVAITPQTKFRIGSVTKQFTAAAILKLNEQGKLSLDDTLAKYLPDFPRGKEVTLRHLLTHTSGIHSYTSKPDFLEQATKPVKPAELIQSFKDDPYDFDPGRKWLYNNSGYFLLGYLVEQISGQSYGEYLRRTFFEPLGMKDTGVHQAGQPLEHEASGYSYQRGEVKKALNWDMSRAGGAGALYSTVGDLYRWNEAVFGGKVLAEASLKPAWTPVVTAEDDQKTKEEGYGYGWAIVKLRGLLEIGHGGGLHGFSSYLLRLPNEKFTAVVLGNSLTPTPGVEPGRLAHELAQLYLGERMAPRPTALASQALSSKALEAYVGRYDYGNAVMTVTREGDHLFAQLAGQPKYEVFAKGDDQFFWKVVEAEVKFVRDAKGKVTKAVHRQSGMTIQAPRLEDLTQAQVSSALFDAYVGRYDYGQGKMIMTVTKEGSHLYAQMTGQPKFEIFPKSETEFFWKVVDARVQFVKSAQGKVVKVVHFQGGQRIEAPRLD